MDCRQFGLFRAIVVNSFGKSFTNKYPYYESLVYFVSTHNVVNDADDEILCTLRRLHLFNASSDRVKVIYHPGLFCFRFLFASDKDL